MRIIQIEMALCAIITGSITIMTTQADIHLWQEVVQTGAAVIYTTMALVTCHTYILDMKTMWKDNIHLHASKQKKRKQQQVKCR